MKERTMTNKIIIGQLEWTIPDAGVDTVRTGVETALSQGSVAVLNLLNADKHPVTVYFNGATVQTVVFDLDSDRSDRPNEFGG
jgi:hypothetical protein